MQFTYGWQRAEILGALINGVFLLALCFTIFVEAIERFFNPVDIDKPELVLYVGSAGLVVNLLGLVLFHGGSSWFLLFGHQSTHLHAEHGHGHHHHDHDHDHDQQHSHSHTHSHSHSHSHDEKNEHANESSTGTRRQKQQAIAISTDDDGVELRQTPPISAVSSEGARSTDRLHRGHSETPDIDPSPNRLNPYLPHADVLPNGEDKSLAAKKRRHQNLNMHGVFLHVLGDALGSVAVIISALVIWLTTWEHRFVFDPIISLLITAIILVGTIPLVRSAGTILLQGTPQNMKMDQMRDELLKIDGVRDIHELHVWQLSDTKIIASVHVVCSEKASFMDLAAEIKQLLHNYGIHSITVQPEYMPGRLLWKCGCVDSHIRFRCRYRRPIGSMFATM